MLVLILTTYTRFAAVADHAAPVAGEEPSGKRSDEAAEKKDDRLPVNFVPFQKLRESLPCDRNPLSFPRGELTGVCYQKKVEDMTATGNRMSPEEIADARWEYLGKTIALADRKPESISADENGTLSGHNPIPTFKIPETEIPEMQLKLGEGLQCYDYKKVDKSELFRQDSSQHFTVTTFDSRFRVGKNKEGRKVLLMEYYSENSLYCQLRGKGGEDQRVAAAITENPKYLKAHSHVSIMCAYNLTSDIEIQSPEIRAEAVSKKKSCTNCQPKCLMPRLFRRGTIKEISLTVRRSLS